MHERPTTSGATAGTPADRRARGGLRVGMVLMLVAIVPLFGIGLVSVWSVGDARRTSQAATAAAEAARQALRASQVEVALADEMFLAIDAVVGAPGATEPRAARERTDGLIDADDRVLAEALADARSAAADPVARLQLYDAARLLSVDATDRALESLLWSITVANHDGRLLETSLGLVYLVDTQRAIAEQFTASVALAVDVRNSPRLELTRLIEQRGRLNTNLATLLPLARTVTAFGNWSAQRDPEQAFAGLVVAIDGRIETALATPLPPQAPSPGSPAAAEVASDLRELREITTMATVSTDSMLQVLTSIAAGETEAVRAGADQQVRRAYGLAGVLIVATVAIVLAAARFIVRPIRELEQAANDLRDGIAPTPPTMSGPVEIRAAAAAIGDAAVHLELVTDQALALASGDLDAAVLEQHDPTGLGAALQLAVATLRSALVEQEGLRRELAHEAAHDALTGLPNRRSSLARLNDALARWRRTDAQIVVLFLDVDHFKVVNDTHGHRAGDHVLTTIAHRLSGAVREGDHVGRLAGDEFVVIAEPVDGPVDATALARRILSACSDPIRLGDAELRVGVSIGIASSVRSVADEADEVLHRADLALYRAKSAGRGTVAV